MLVMMIAYHMLKIDEENFPWVLHYRLHAILCSSCSSFCPRAPSSLVNKQHIALAEPRGERMWYEGRLRFSRICMLYDVVYSWRIIACIIRFFVLSEPCRSLCWWMWPRIDDSFLILCNQSHSSIVFHICVRTTIPDALMFSRLELAASIHLFNDCSLWVAYGWSFDRWR